MENMDKELTVPKLVLIVRPKIPQMLQNLSALLVCPSPKVWDFNEKRFYPPTQYMTSSALLIRIPVKI